MLSHEAAGDGIVAVLVTMLYFVMPNPELRALRSRRSLRSKSPAPTICYAASATRRLSDFCVL